MQLQTTFVFLKTNMSIHWDNGWVTSTNDRFFDIESAARAQCVNYLTERGRSPEDYRRQISQATANVRDQATVGLSKRSGLVHRLARSAHRFNAFDHARSLLPKPKAAWKRAANYFGHRSAIELKAIQPPI